MQWDKVTFNLKGNWIPLVLHFEGTAAADAPLGMKQRQMVKI